METIIDAHNVSRIYNPDTVPVYAVNNVHLHLEKGEFTALVGPSGSGKTTLLNILGGLDKPDTGQVFVGGTDITALSGNELIEFRLNNIGFIFQSFNLIPVLTARENIEFILLLQNVSKKERNERVLQLLEEVGLSDKEEVGLSDKADSRPAELSGGQQQRVAVARALASKPRFILADEPTANLDSKSAGKLLDIMAKLNKEEDMTFIFSTHDQRVIERARRVITLVDGKIDSDTARVLTEHE